MTRAELSDPWPSTTVLYLVDGDEAARQSLQALLTSFGHRISAFAAPRDFLEIAGTAEPGCVIADAGLQEREGLRLPEELRRRGLHFPVIFTASGADVATAMAAIHAGAVDFVEKPFTAETIDAAIRRALADLNRTRRKDDVSRIASQRLELLTFREREVLQGLIASKTNRDIAGDLAISVRTVEFYRGRIMRKMHAHGVSELVQLALAAGMGSDLGMIARDRRYNG